MKSICKKLTFIMSISIVAMFLLLFGLFSNTISAEETIPEGYTPIYTFEDLYAVRNNLSGNYILMNDIDMTELTAPGGDWDINGTGWEPIGTYDEPFKGIFDGNSHAIIGMNIHGDVQYNSVGLFGGAYSATIKNLGVLKCDININNSGAVGAIASEIRWQSQIYNCMVSGKIIVTGYSPDVGGVVGNDHSDYYYTSNNIKDCYNSADITVYNTNSDYGSGYSCGIAGGYYGKATNCYNTGNISLSGRGIMNAISANEYNDSQDCYYLKGTCEGQESIAGVCSALSVAQMKSESAFTNWDFENTWIIDTTSSYKYPQLRNCMQVPVTEIELVSPPEKVTYVKGDVLDLTGGKISVYHESDNSEGELDINKTMLGTYDMNSVGSQTITVSYLECSTSFDITVIPQQITNLKITSVTDENVSLTWDRQSGATGYIVYKYNFTDETWEVYDTVATANYTDSEENLNTEFKYAISSYIRIDEQDYISEKVEIEKPINISETQINIDDIVFAGYENMPQLVVPEVSYNGQILVEGTDYNITDGDYSFSSPGEYTVTISGTGRFAGDIEIQYTVVCTHNEEYGYCSLCYEKLRLFGDISGNGEIDLYDAIEIAKILMGMIEFDASVHYIADYNEDNYIDLYDAIDIAMYIMNK